MLAHSISQPHEPYIGRLAPSPTGAQHLGNARTFLITWLLCRRAHGKLLFRNEDLETPRIKFWATDQAIEDLRWLGLDWEDGPNFLNGGASHIIQSQRTSRYTAVLASLIESGAVYPCTCTRSEIDAMAGAPHESALDGPVYPGICSKSNPDDAKEFDRNGVPYAWRFRMPRSPLEFVDEFCGAQVSQSPAEQLGDFVVARANGATAYQLAVVVDDHDSAVSNVVRGDDLVLSTFRQLAIYQQLGWSHPTFCHLPLVVGQDGRRLAKRHGDTRLSTLRRTGIDAKTVVGYLAYRSGIIEDYLPVRPDELLDINPLIRLSQSVCIFDSENAVEQFRQLQKRNP